MISEHVIWFGVNWASPLLLLVFGSFFVQILQRFFGEALAKMGFGMARGEMNVDEDLPHFYNIIKMSQRNQLTKMYENMQKNFGFEFTDPDTINELALAPFPKYTIVGTPWYSILSNPQYLNAFSFVPSYVNEREKIIVDGYPDAEEGDEKEKKFKCVFVRER